MNYSNEEIVEGFRNDDKKIISHCKNIAMSYILVKVGYENTYDRSPEDYLAECIEKFYNACSKKDFIIKKSYKAYIKRIIKHIHADKMKQKAKTPPTTNIEQQQQAIKENFSPFSQEIINIILNTIKQLSTKCQKHIQYKVKNHENKKKYPLKKIAQILGYESENSAKSARYDCKQKLKDLLLNNPPFSEIINNYPYILKLLNS